MYGCGTTVIDEQPLSDDIALVTGASSGIGRATAFELAKKGADVALSARREEKLQEIASEIEDEHNITAHIAPADLTDESDVTAMVDSVIDTFGSLDVLVYSAGTGVELGVDLEDVGTDQYEAVMGVNVDGAFYTTQAALPHLRKSKGTIILVGSYAGNYPKSATPVYAGSKWWIRGFGLSLAGHVGEDDVGVSVVSTSEVRTSFGKDFREEEDLAKERFDRGETTEPPEVAEAIAFVANQEPPNAVTELNLYRRDKLKGF